MKILFISYAAPEEVMLEVCSKDLFPPVAADKLQWNIIKGLDETDEVTLDILSSLPVSDYPHYPMIFFKKISWNHAEGSQDIIIPFINITVIKHVTKFFSMLFYISRWLIRYRKITNKKIMLYEIYSPHFFAAVVATTFLGGSIVSWVTDMPVGTGITRNPIKKFLKPLSNMLAIALLKKMAGLVVLTKQIALDFAPNVPYIVVEGMISEATNNKKEENETFSRTEKVVFYAGLLREEYGIQLLVDAFSLIEYDTYHLWIFGRGDMEDRVKLAAQKDSRIIYGGFVPNSEVMKKARQATVLINPRPSKRSFTAYSFPSKLIEYMSTGRPVISTRLPGIPEEYYSYIFPLDDESPRALADLIQDVCSKNEQELWEYGTLSKRFIYDGKNYKHQMNRIYKFMTRLQ